jgi:hypothetical protein
VAPPSRASRTEAAPAPTLRQRGVFARKGARRHRRWRRPRRRWRG